MRPEDKEFGQPLEAGEGKETGSPLKPSERRQPAHILSLAQQD